MVTWGRAFRGALAYILWSIIWIIIGAVIIVGGIYFGYISGTYGPFGIPVPNFGIIIAAVIIGYIIISLGAIAALFKILAEITAEEVEKRAKSRVS
jgi:hypothetical protein